MFIEHVREVELRQVGYLKSVWVNGAMVFATENQALADSVSGGFVQAMGEKAYFVHSIKAVRHEDH